MDFVKQIFLQFKTIFSKLSVSQRISFLLIFASIGICLVLVFVWSAKPDYVVLFSDLSTDDAAKIHNKLIEMKVPYQVAGTTIKVPSQQVYETRLLLANEGLPKGSTIGYEIFDKNSIGQTDYLQRLNFQRALEGELSRTISSLESVEFARVHLVMPKPTIYATKEEKATASIIITPRGQLSVSKSNIVAITHLVASSVEGLEPGDVTIIDSNGNLLSSQVDTNGAVALTSSQLEIQQNIERYLENKASTLLMGVLGPGKAIVRVSADIDFSQNEKTQESYNPESQVARSENRIEESSTEKEGSNNSVEKTVTNYEINKTVEHIIGATGAMKRLSLAVVVDGTYKMQGEGDKKERVYVARTDEEKESIRRLVTTSIGLNNERGDSIEVINIPFDTSYLEEERIQMDEMKRAETMKNISQQWPWVLVVLIFGALFISLQKIIAQASLTRVAIGGGGAAKTQARAPERLSREEMYEKMRQQEEASQAQEDEASAMERIARERVEEEVIALAAQSPDAVAKIIKGWLAED